MLQNLIYEQTDYTEEGFLACLDSSDLSMLARSLRYQWKIHAMHVMSSKVVLLL